MVDKVDPVTKVNLMCFKYLLNQLRHLLSVKKCQFNFLKVKQKNTIRIEWDCPAKTTRGGGQRGGLPLKGQGHEI